MTLLASLPAPPLVDDCQAGYRVVDRRSADRALSRIFSMPHLLTVHRLLLNFKQPKNRKEKTSVRDQRTVLGRMSHDSGSTVFS